MHTLLVTSPARIEAKDIQALVPDRLKGWHIEERPSRSLNQMATSPDVTLVQLGEDTQPAELNTLITSLVRIQKNAAKRSYILFSFKVTGKVTGTVTGRLPREIRAALGEEAVYISSRVSGRLVTQINERLHAFPNPDQVSVTFAKDPSEMRAELEHIGAKLDLSLQGTGVQLPRDTPRGSPLDRVKAAVKLTEDLRVANGNLSAAAVATAFGISLNQLAGWLGRTRQALNKTPDADSLQPELAFFERVARLRAVVSKDKFQKWLRMPNEELDGKKPLELLANGERQVVADLVDDMLTGAPV